MHREPIDERVQPLGLEVDVQLISCSSACSESLDGVEAEAQHLGMGPIPELPEIRVDWSAGHEGEPHFDSRASLRVEDEQALESALDDVRGCFPTSSAAATRCATSSIMSRIAKVSSSDWLGKMCPKGSLGEAGLGRHLPHGSRPDSLAKDDTPKRLPELSAARFGVDLGQRSHT